MELRIVRPEDRELLWNVNQKYLYEMTDYYDDPMDEAGNYHYGYFDAYFTDSRRTALFIYESGRLAGFALINPYSAIGGAPDHTMAEFTVFPAFRRRHIASQAAREIFARFPGKWEIKYNERNTAAKSLWTGLAARYHPTVTHINDAETVLLFDTLA